MNNPQSPPSQSPYQPPPTPRQKIPDMATPLLATTDDDSSALWDWGDLLDFATEDQLVLPWDSDSAQLPPVLSPPPEPSPKSPTPPLVGGPDRVRKRDPRMTCSNFLAGRIPCACPEIDEKMQEEEEGLPGKKRVRTVRAAAGTARAAAGTARCQVPGCEADISELKGYHRRHRVCLRCANASTVLLDGQRKRYCQQCGKFHILSDFDEGKRSCRRKLERHNNRRRRKPVDSKSTVEKESQIDQLSEDVACDEEMGKDIACLDSQNTEREALLEPEDVLVSSLCSVPGSQVIQCDSGLSFVAPGDTQMDGGKDNFKSALSSSYCDNKSAYSSMCSTGRISFKLYDWNPAEFPRRLRHQIFQWLASMPVELEGYIRPGCTILTAFIAMPKLMWIKLFEDPVLYVRDIVVAPGRVLSGKGTLYVYLNDMTFYVGKDGTSITKVKRGMQAPRLHHVHPICFEAGKPMEFVACGSNLIQPKFRFLISFAGKYLAYDYCVAVPQSETEGDSCGFEHQLYKIYINNTEPNLFGPAFIEVENESGLSNFLPIIIGSREVYSEIKTIQQRFDASSCSDESQLVPIGSWSDLCEDSVSRQTAISEFILDIAWLFRKPTVENTQHILISSQIQRFNCLLGYLIQNEFIAVLDKILQYVEIVMDNVELNTPSSGVNDADIRLFHKHMNCAREILSLKIQESAALVLDLENSVSREEDPSFRSSCENDIVSVIPITKQNFEMREDWKLEAMHSSCSTSLNRGETVSLLDRDIVMNVELVKEWPKKSCRHIISTRIYSRPFAFIFATATICFGICAVVFHPQKVGEFAVTIRRCLFDHK